VTVLGAEQVQQRAPSTIADIVNEMPSFRQTATNTQNQRGNGNGGQNRVDLRGLSPERTLVLVNGRRHVPTNLTGTLDVNVIPTPLVDRVEVVTGGASAAYGSDAVSGVVNFLLKDRIEGFQTTAQYRFSEEGDDIEPTFGLATGAEFAGGNGHFVIGGDFSDNKGVGTLYTRDWGRKQPGLVSFGAAATRGNLPAQGLLNNVTYSTQADGGVINSGPLRGTAFRADGTPYQIQYGTIYSNLMVGGNNGPDANPFGNWKIESPHQRATGLAKVDYDFNENLSAFAEYGYAEIKADGLSSYHQAPALIVPISNPFIPAATRAQMQANGLTSITVGRYETQLGGYQLLATNQVNRGTVGLKGSIFGDWNWDVYYEQGETKGHQVVKTNIFEGNYLASTYVVTGADGQPQCGPLASNPNMTAARAAQVLPGCVPFNIFGRESPSDAALAYIKYRSNNATQYKQRVVAANLSGELFSTWAGPVSSAIGVEHRKESGFSLADPYGAQLVALSNNGSTYSGDIEVTEGYTEVGVPLAKTLDLNGAIRRTHYDTSGSVTTWKVGMTYEPIDSVRLRVTKSRDIRAANIVELYQGRSQGITASFLNPINNQTGPINTISGGNPNLDPEIAENWTAGVVFQPTWDWARGLRLSVDYFSVDISNVIATVAAADIARRCANGIQEYCALITFDNSASGIKEIQQVPANLNRLKTDGLDIEIAYRLPIEALGLPGRLELRSLSTWTNHLTTIDAVSSIDRAGSGALGGVPEWNNNTSLTYAINDLSTSLQLRYTSAIKGDASLIDPTDAGYNSSLPNSINVNHFPSATYLNWTVQYDILKNENQSLQVFGLINNVLNKDPADLAIVAFASGGNPYDVIGRVYKVGARYNF
jgi:outer membrane receptor protein involved in Fe transport